MPWNHRVLVSEFNNEFYFQIHEVYYNKEGSPEKYSENPTTIGGEDLYSVKWTTNRISDCLKKTVLWAGEKFPNEAKITYECVSCGRDKFTSKTPHICSGQLRKRKLQWKMNCI
jgi:hypothetical protein